MMKKLVPFSLGSFFATILFEKFTIRPLFKWEHEKQEWLKPNKIKDINGNKPESPDYDPTTLYVPKEYISKCTPGLGNWWKIKAKNFDTVIFYKVGKFYELYHMDAILGVNFCGLTYMKARVRQYSF